MKLIEIQKSLKKKYHLDIICIQCGKFFMFIFEDARLISDHFGFKIKRRGDFEFTGFPIFSNIDRFIEFFDKEKLEYAFLHEYKNIFDDHKEEIHRIVTHSSIAKAMGAVYTNVKPYKQSKVIGKTAIIEDTFLNAILDGFDPITGEVLDDSSAWKHPQIQNYIKKLLESTNMNIEITPKRRVLSDEIRLSDNDLFLLKYLLLVVSAITPKLKAREDDIIQSLYSLDNSNVATSEQAGRQFKISKERLRQIKEKNIKKITRSKHDLYIEQSADKKNHRMKDSYKLDPSVNTDYFQLPDVNMIEEGEYFKLEDLISFTPVSSQLSAKWLESWAIEDYVHNFRNNNIYSKRLINHGMPITKEEISLIIKMKNKKYSLGYLEKYFQRSSNTIEIIILSNQTRQ